MSELLDKLKEEFGAKNISSEFDEINLIVNKQDIFEVSKKLHDKYNFDVLIDLCGVDYSTYGKSNWNVKTDNFIRSREEQQKNDSSSTQFCVVYHLLSINNNCRLRVKAYLTIDDLIIDSVINIWNCADWFEREAFDLFGILFNNHPDLRRILTDYGFIGHPLRKDFPTCGEVEMCYDEKLKRVIYKKVSIDMIENVPRIIRE